MSAYIDALKQVLRCISRCDCERPALARC